MSVGTILPRAQKVTAATLVRGAGMNAVMLVLAWGYLATLVAFAEACDLYLAWDAGRAGSRRP